MATYLHMYNKPYNGVLKIVRLEDTGVGVIVTCGEEMFVFSQHFQCHCNSFFSVTIYWTFENVIAGAHVNLCKFHRLQAWSRHLASNPRKKELLEKYYLLHSWYLIQLSHKLYVCCVLYEMTNVLVQFVCAQCCSSKFFKDIEITITNYIQEL